MNKGFAIKPKARPTWTKRGQIKAAINKQIKDRVNQTPPPPLNLKLTVK
tara:strand:+ start:653 stop:799 length:147 start_codon:yes stop_codon:yes gene_type:complete